MLALIISQLLFVKSSLDGKQLVLAHEELLLGVAPWQFNASRYEQKVTEAPARVIPFTSYEIQIPVSGY